MDSIINVSGNGKEVKVWAGNGKVNADSLKSAFMLQRDVPIRFLQVDDQHGSVSVPCCYVNDEQIFSLLKGWQISTTKFIVEWKEACSIVEDARPSSPYPEVSRSPAPMGKSIDKWMFFSYDSAGKSTVICIHPRFFVTFRHGSHLQLKDGDPLTIYKAKQEIEEQVGINVSVAKINDALDFILLKSERDVVEKGPPLVIAEESESFTLAGFGNEQQNLSYLPGTIYSIRGYYSHFQGDMNLMGPFTLGTGRSSAGDSGGGCWGAYGLIGMNVAVTMMPSTSHFSAISEAAVFSPKNIISPSSRFKEAFLEELEKEQKEKEKVSPRKKKKRYPRKKPCNMIEFEGIGIGYGSFD